MSHVLPASTSASTKRFDVVCMGERVTTTAPSPRGVSSGAAGLASVLARGGLAVGLVSAFTDDIDGRAQRREIEQAGVDVEGAAFGPRASGILLLEGTRSGRGREVVPYREEELALDVPAGWQSAVLALSGVAPALSYVASLCRAARASRRHGGLVVLDVRARFHAWKGRDPRTLHALLAEADLVRCRVDDLAVLGLDEGSLRAWVRPDAAIVLTRADDRVHVSTARGELVLPAAELPLALRTEVGDVSTAYLVRALVRGGKEALLRGATWEAMTSDGVATFPVGGGLSGSGPVRRRM